MTDTNTDTSTHLLAYISQDRVEPLILSDEPGLDGRTLIFSFGTTIFRATLFEEAEIVLSLQVWTLTGWQLFAEWITFPTLEATYRIAQRIEIAHDKLRELS